MEKDKKEGILRRLMKDEIFVLVLIILAAFLVRNEFLVIKTGIRSDTAEFIISGQNLVMGKGYTSITGYPDTAFPPMYPAMIGVTWLAIGDGIMAGRILSIVFGSLLVVPIYLITRKLYNRRTGYMAAAFIAFYFSLIYGSVTAMPEIVFTMLSVSGIFIGLKAFEEKRPLYYFLAGIVLSIAYLTRLEGFGYIVVLVLVTVLFWLLGKNTLKDTRRVIISLVSLAIGFLIVASPYMTFLYQETGKLQIGSKDAFFILGTEQNYLGRRPSDSNITNGTETVLDIYRGRIGRETDVLSFVANNPDRVANAWVSNTWHMVAQRLPHKFPIWLFAIAGLGLFASSWDHKRFRREIYMIMVVLYGIVSYGFFVTSARSAMLTISLLIIWLAKGTDVLNGWFEKTLPRIKTGKLEGIKAFIMGSETLKKLPFIIVMLSILPLLILPLGWENPEADAVFWETGDWIKNNVPNDARILVREFEIAYYADMRFVISMPYGNSSQIIEYARYHKADYIVADWLMTAEKDFPMATGMFEPESMPPDIELVYDNGNEEMRMLIYRVIGNQSQA